MHGYESLVSKSTPRRIASLALLTSRVSYKETDRREHRVNCWEERVCARAQRCEQTSGGCMTSVFACGVCGRFPAEGMDLLAVVGVLVRVPFHGHLSITLLDCTRIGITRDTQQVIILGVFWHI